jgi:general secretion pathway protein A
VAQQKAWQARLSRRRLKRRARVCSLEKKKRPQAARSRRPPKRALASRLDVPLAAHGGSDGQEADRVLAGLRGPIVIALDIAETAASGNSMYATFYGLQEIPFGLTPDPKYIFVTESYLEVMANLKYGVEYNKGMVVVTGEVGTGKTTTLRSMIHQFGRDVVPVYIFNPLLTVQEFFELFMGGLGLDTNRSASKSDMLTMLGRFLAEGHARGLRTVLVLDEAHALPSPLLEEVRLLANFETNKEKLLQIVLCGQPELRLTLNRPDLRQLKQRISLRCSIKPLLPREVTKYVRFRLKTAGAERVDVFDDEALELIAQASLGIPRLVNNICDNALLYGYAGGRKLITKHVIEEVIDTLDLAAPPVRNEYPASFYDSPAQHC